VKFTKQARKVANEVIDELCGFDIMGEVWEASDKRERKELRDALTVIIERCMVDVMYQTVAEAEKLGVSIP
jgi:hypothetical protein